MKNIVILISGSGSNMAAIARTAQKENWQNTFDARIAAVISNKPEAQGLALAQGLGLAAEALPHRDFDSREAFDSALMARIDRHSPHLVVLAGFMRILTPGFVAHYAGRIINIHPSLLPAFTGLHTHQRVAKRHRRHAGRPGADAGAFDLSAGGARLSGRSRQPLKTAAEKTGLHFLNPVVQPGRIHVSPP